MNDKTSKIENDVEKEYSPSLKYLCRLWKYVLKSTKIISGIYLGLFLILSILRPVLALIWGHYISISESIKHTNIHYVMPILLIIIYALINWLADLLESFMAVAGDGDLEQLDLVQANRQQELMHSSLFRKISKINPEYFEIPEINNKINQIFQFAGDRFNGINRKIMLNSYIIIAKILSVISIAVTLYVINPWLTISLMIAILPTLWNSMILEKIRFKFVKDNTELKRQADYFQRLMLSASSKEIKTLGLYNFFYKKWKSLADQYTFNERKIIRKQMILGIIDSTIINTMNIIGIMLGIILMTKGIISLGKLGVIMQLVVTLISDTGILLSSIASFISKKNNAAQFFELMDMKEQENVVESADAIRSIAAANLKYRYPLTNRYILDGINIEIHRGEKIAFVGENGAGKSTFIKLILGLIKPSDGTMTFNGISTEKVNPIEHYERQAVVVQNPSHYTTFTLGDNVYLGNTQCERDENKIDEALKFIGLNNVNKDEVLGRDIGGIDMSGGQWQKLAIARTVYRDKDFIILDEPTSNLDPITESEIFSHYIAMAKDKTVIFVTHRISVASLADRIVVFDQGKIVEDGTHEKLMTQNKKYAELYNSQSQWYDR